jgi:hypothetical protein
MFPHRQKLQEGKSEDLAGHMTLLTIRFSPKYVCKTASAVHDKAQNVLTGKAKQELVRCQLGIKFLPHSQVLMGV